MGNRSLPNVRMDTHAQDSDTPPAQTQIIRLSLPAYR